MLSKRVQRGFDRAKIRRAQEAKEPPMPEGVIALLPFQIGRFQLAIEAALVVKILGPHSRPKLEMKEERRAIASLWEDFGGAFFGEHDSIVALGPQEEDRVIFQVYSIGRLIHLPIESIAPLPSVIQENIRISYLWGVADHHDELYLLLDPKALFHAAQKRTAHG